MTPRTLAQVYADVPDVPCKGLCQEACGPIGCSAIEADQLQDNGLALPRVRVHPQQGPMTCSHLTDAGRCAIYAHRPMVCRLFGAVKAMTCPHGCRPAGGMLTDEAARALAMELQAMSGGRIGHLAIDL